MESITWELAVAEGDPYDRTLGCMIRSGKNMVMARSLRVAPAERIGSILLTVDRITIAWAVPQMKSSEHVHDVWDEEDRRIGYGPF